MQTIERGGYSRQEILDVLHAKNNARRVRFRYDLLDKDENYIKTLDCVLEGEIEMNAFATIKRTAKFKIKEKYVPEHVERRTVQVVSYSDSTFSGGTHSNTVSTINSPFDGGSWIRISTPATNALTTEESTFGTTGWGTGGVGVHPDWQAWNPNSAGTFLATTDSLGGYAHGIRRTAAGSLGIQTKRKPISVTNGTRVYLSFFFKPINDPNGNFAVPNYCYIIHNDGRGNIHIPTYGTYTITNLGDGWYRYDGSVVCDRTDTVGCLIGWSNGTNGEVAIDNVFFGTQPPIWTAQWTSEVINISSGKPNTTVTNSQVTFQSQVPPYATFTLESRVSLDGGQTWSAWAPQESGTQLTGLPYGTDLGNVRVQFRMTVSRRNPLDHVGMDNLTLTIDGEYDEFVPEQPEINYISDRIQPFMEVQMPDGNWIEFPLGIFLLSTPTKRDEVNGVYREIEAYDGLIILNDDKFMERYYIPAGKKYTDAVIDILRSAGIKKYNIADSPKTLQAPIEFPIGMSKLEAVNSLLEAINYTQIWVDARGYFTASPYIPPSERAIDYEYLDNEISVIYNGIEEELDFFGVPNVWVVTQSNPEKPPLVSVKVNNNPDSPTSTVNVGRNIVDFREVDDIADQETLDAYTERIAFEASQVYGRLRFKTALMPFHEYMDVLRVRYSPLKIDDKFSEVSWKMVLRAGGKMEHEVRKVVTI